MLAQFKERTLKKDYLAIVVGKVPLHSDYIDLPIGKDPRRSERMRIDVAGGKSSSTFYEVLERLPGHTVLRAVPLTGRTHQIRVHLAHLGFPVLLDSTYGRAQAHLFQRACRQWMEEGLAAPSLDRQALHARRIAFVHPVDGRTLEFEAPVPRDLQEVIEFLRRQRE
jgi:23S rRNA pseudouridine1911/1915/1917 synthase